MNTYKKLRTKILGHSDGYIYLDKPRLRCRAHLDHNGWEKTVDLTLRGQFAIASFLESGDIKVYFSKSRFTLECARLINKFTPAKVYYINRGLTRRGRVRLIPKILVTPGNGTYAIGLYNGIKVDKFGAVKDLDKIPQMPFEIPVNKLVIDTSDGEPEVQQDIPHRRVHRRYAPAAQFNTEDYRANMSRIMEEHTLQMAARARQAQERHQDLMRSRELPTYQALPQPGADVSFISMPETIIPTQNFWNDLEINEP